MDQIGEKKRLYEAYNTLIVAVNDVEYKTMIETMTQEMNIDKPIIENIGKYVVCFGVFCGKKVAVVKLTAMGINRPGDARDVIEELAKVLTISSIFMIGVCAGMTKKVKKGDVVIASEIVDYLGGKIVDTKDGAYDLISRGHHYYPGDLYTKVDTIIAKSNFDGFKVKKGVALSNNVLLNSKEFKKVILEKYPEAFALEMEGIGLALASGKVNNSNWILIKGISDFGVNKRGSEGQKIAVQNAILTLKKILMSPIYNLQNVLEPINSKINVFVSGSFEERHKKAKEIQKYAHELGYKLIKNNLKIVTGYGLVIGPGIATGAELMAQKMHINLDDAIIKSPIGKVYDPIQNKEAQLIKKENRMKLLRAVKYAVFIFGFKANSKKNYANGMEDELTLAHANHAICIPVASTGYTAKILWNKVMQEWDIYHPKANENIRMLFNKLDNENMYESMETILNIIKEYEAILA